MADAQRTVDIIFKGTNQLGTGVSSVESTLGGIGDEAAEAEGKTRDLGESVTDLGDKPRASADKLGNALKALAASLVIKDFIDANVQFESFERTMTLVTGSVEDAGKEFEYLTELSNTLGLEVLSTAKNYGQLAAATRGTNLEGQGTREIFEAVSTAMSALGKSSADTEGALLAVTQIVSKGTVSMEELRQQLGERIPGAFQIAADSMGVTTAEMNDLVATGELTADVFLPKFAAEMKKTFGDVAYVDTYTASMNRMKNSITDAELQIGRAGAFDVLKTVIQGGTLAVVGSIAAFEVFGKVIGTVVGAIASLDFSDLGRSIDEIMQDGADKTMDARDAFLGLNVVAKEVGVSLKEVARDNGDLWKLEPIAAFSNEMEEVAEKTAKAALTLEKLASNERIKSIEARVELNIAEIEADAQRAVAIIETLGTTISGTQDLLGNLFGDLGDADNFNDRFLIEDQIELENDRLDEQLALQRRQVESELYLNRLKAEALRSGDSLVTINGDGLQPHLEAFMWEILEAIQVRTNADGLSMLLGTP